jgi:hypothetical protein
VPVVGLVINCPTCKAERAAEARGRGRRGRRGEPEGDGVDYDLDGEVIPREPAVTLGTIVDVVTRGPLPDAGPDGRNRTW